MAAVESNAFDFKIRWIPTEHLESNQEFFGKWEGFIWVMPDQEGSESDTPPPLVLPAEGALLKGGSGEEGETLLS